MDTTTALAFTLNDEKAVQQINSIRADHDRACKRWMPHINFIFPFVNPSQFEQVRQTLAKLNVEPFDVVFDKVSHFAQGKMCTVNLQCDAESEKKLCAVFNQILKACPEIEVKRVEFHPHLTLGQCKKSDLQAITETFTKTLCDVIGKKFPFTELQFLHRTPESDDKMVSEVSLRFASEKTA